MGTFIDDLDGVRELRLNDDNPVPRRKVLRIVSSAAEVLDDAIAGETRLTLATAPPDGAYTAPQLTGNTDDWLASLTTLDQYNVLRCSAAAPYAISGLSELAQLRVYMINIGTQPITLKHEQGSLPPSAPNNRFLCPGGADYSLAAGAVVEVLRDVVSERWRPVL